LTTISARIETDSINSKGDRITTFVLRYPLAIHAELMTHRVFSRNAGSSRAVPVKRMIKNVLTDMYVPIHWGKNQPGMQANEELSFPIKLISKGIWILAGWFACLFAYILHLLGGHKQNVNRIIAPWNHISVIVTSTDYDNWFLLRSHIDAEPHIRKLSDIMSDLYLKNVPDVLPEDEWHLPFITEYEKKNTVLTIEQLKKMSSARCARVSYETHDGKNPDYKIDIRLYDKLIVSKPSHYSPIEHQAKADPEYNFPELHGNFNGFIQFRKQIEAITNG